MPKPAMSRRERKRLHKRRARLTPTERFIKRKERIRNTKINEIRARIAKTELSERVSDAMDGKNLLHDDGEVIEWKQFERQYEESAAMVIQNSMNIRALVNHPDLPEAVKEDSSYLMLQKLVVIGFVKLADVLSNLAAVHLDKDGVIEPGTGDATLAKELFNSYVTFNETLLTTVTRMAEPAIEIAAIIADHTAAKVDTDEEKTE